MRSGLASERSGGGAGPRSAKNGASSSPSSRVILRVSPAKRVQRNSPRRTKRATVALSEFRRAGAAKDPASPLKSARSKVAPAAETTSLHGRKKSYVNVMGQHDHDFIRDLVAQGAELVHEEEDDDDGHGDRRAPRATSFPGADRLEQRRWDDLNEQGSSDAVTRNSFDTLSFRGGIGAREEEVLANVAHRLVKEVDSNRELRKTVSSARAELRTLKEELAAARAAQRLVAEGFDFSTGGRDDRVELEARRAAEVEKRIRNDTAGKSKESTIENIRRNIERRMMEYGLAPVRRGVTPTHTSSGLKLSEPSLHSQPKSSRFGATEFGQSGWGSQHELDSLSQARPSSKFGGRPPSTSSHVREWSTATTIRHVAQGLDAPEPISREAPRSFRPISTSASADLSSPLAADLPTGTHSPTHAIPRGGDMDEVSSRTAPLTSGITSSTSSVAAAAAAQSSSVAGSLASTAREGTNLDDKEALSTAHAAGHLHISRRGSIHLTVPDPAHEEYVKERIHLKRFADGSIVVDTMQDQQDPAEIRTSLRDRFASPRRGWLPAKGDSAALISPKMRLELERFKLAEHLRVAERQEVSTFLSDHYGVTDSLPGSSTNGRKGREMLPEEIALMMVANEQLIDEMWGGSAGEEKDGAGASVAAGDDKTGLSKALALAEGMSSFAAEATETSQDKTESTRSMSKDPMPSVGTSATATHARILTGIPPPSHPPPPLRSATVLTTKSTQSKNKAPLPPPSNAPMPPPFSPPATPEVAQEDVVVQAHTFGGSAITMQDEAAFLQALDSDSSGVRLPLPPTHAPPSLDHEGNGQSATHPEMRNGRDEAAKGGSKKKAGAVQETAFVNPALAALQRKRSKEGGAESSSGAQSTKPKPEAQPLSQPSLSSNAQDSSSKANMTSKNETKISEQNSKNKGATKKKDARAERIARLKAARERRRMSKMKAKTEKPVSKANSDSGSPLPPPRMPPPAIIEANAPPPPTRPPPTVRERKEGGEKKEDDQRVPSPAPPPGPPPSHVEARGSSPLPPPARERTPELPPLPPPGREPSFGGLEDAAPRKDSVGFRNPLMFPEEAKAAAQSERSPSPPKRAPPPPRIKPSRSARTSGGSDRSGDGDDQDVAEFDVQILSDEGMIDCKCTVDIRRLKIRSKGKFYGKTTRHKFVMGRGLRLKEASTPKAVSVTGPEREGLGPLVFICAKRASLVSTVERFRKQAMSS